MQPKAYGILESFEIKKSSLRRSSLIPAGYPLIDLRVRVLAESEAREEGLANPLPEEFVLTLSERGALTLASKLQEYCRDPEILDALDRSS